MILVDLGREHIIHLLLDRLHLPQYVLSKLVLSRVHVSLVINLTLYVHHSLLDLLVERLHVQLAIVQPLVHRQLLPLVLILNLLHPLVDVCHVDLEIVVLLPLVLDLVLNRLPSAVLEQVNLVLELLDGVLQLLEGLLVGGEVEVGERVVLKVLVDDLGFEFVDLFEQHLFGGVEEVDVAVDFFV